MDSASFNVLRTNFSLPSTLDHSIQKFDSTQSSRDTHKIWERNEMLNNDSISNIYIYIYIYRIKPNYRNFAPDNCNDLKQEKKKRHHAAQNCPAWTNCLWNYYSTLFLWVRIYIYIYNLELGNVPSSQTKLNIYKVALLHSCLGNHKRSINHVHSTWPSPCFFELLLSHTWKKMKNKKKH